MNKKKNEKAINKIKVKALGLNFIKLGYFLFCHDEKAINKIKIK